MAALRALHMGSLRASTGAATPPPHEWTLRLATSHASSARAAVALLLPTSSLPTCFTTTPLSLQPISFPYRPSSLSLPLFLLINSTSSLTHVSSISRPRPLAFLPPMPSEGGINHLPSHGSPSLRAACSDLLAQLLDGEKQRQGWYEAVGEAVAVGRGSRVAEADGGEEWEEQVRGVETRGGRGGLCGEVTATLGGSEWWLAEGQQPLLLRCHRPSHCPSPSERTTQDAACNLL
ncbi:unnamed protein product [Closterium sp. NIES-64]|nr:unnamed protein product [Closterium sp. NIES-64]